MMEEIENKLEACLRARLRYLKDSQTLDMEQDLMELGLDSMSVIDLVLDLEQTFSIIIPDEFLTEDNFRKAGSVRNTVIRLIDNPIAIN